jgi:uncharacterized protein YraI
MRRIGMNRLLLSLWLLGAVLYGANTLIYANVIFGWPNTKQKVDSGNAGKETVKPNAGIEAQSQQSAKSADNKDAATAVSDGPAVRLESNPQSAAAASAQPSEAQASDSGSNASAPVPPAPQGQGASDASAQQQQAQAPQGQATSGVSGQQQAQSTPEVQPVPGEGVAPAPQSQPGQAENVPATQPQQQAEAEWVRISRTGANVRSGPSSSASQLATLPSGMELRVISREAGWVQIANSDGSETGWVYERLLEPAGAPSEQGAAAQGSAQATGPDQHPQGQSEMVRVSGSPATMRSGPSDSAPMLFAFPEGRELRVMSRQPGWVQVIDPGSKQSGWIAEASLATSGAGGQQQQAADAALQRRSRDAPPPAYDSAEGPPPGARGAWLPWEEDMGPPDGLEEPEDRPRGRGHRHNGGFAGILRRAFGGF